MKSVNGNITYDGSMRETWSNHLQTDMFIKQKIMAAVTKHPKGLMFGIAVAITYSCVFVATTRLFQ